MEMERLVLLNSLVTSSRMPITLRTIPISLEFVKYFVRDKDVVSFIGHEATASLLTQLLPVPVPMNRAMYDPTPGDKAIVVRLKKRLEKPEDIKNVKEEDVEFILVEYSNY
jgi:hypothetical protein